MDKRKKTGENPKFIMDSITIILDRISKEYGGKRLIHSLSATLTAGSRTAIVAPSGAGKTTLLRMIMGLVKPDEGTIHYEKPLSVSAAFQEDRLLEYTSPLENIKAVLPNGFRTEQEICKELSQVALNEAAYRTVSLLSGGMKRRTALVRAVMMPGNLLVLDEPFKGLDEKLKRQVMEYVETGMQGRTFLIVTHDKNEAEFFQAKMLEFK